MADFQNGRYVSPTDLPTGSIPPREPLYPARDAPGYDCGGQFATLSGTASRGRMNRSAMVGDTVQVWPN